MNKNELYIYVGLVTVLGAALGLMTSIIYQKNIPLSLIIGAAIGSLLCVLFLKITDNKKQDL